VSRRNTALVHLGAGIGNVVLATPLLVALQEMDFTTDVLLAADYAETADLLRPWAAVRQIILQDGPPCPASEYSCVIPAIPPFYMARFGRVVARLPRALPRPADGEFFRNEQEWYFSFARALGYPSERAPTPHLPIGPSERFEITNQTVVLAPGCKTGEMAAKRWPRFVELAETLDDVVVVGTSDDLARHDGSRMIFPPHVRSFVGKLTLRETAELMASAGVVVGNDSGLSHVAAAVGVHTIMLFGPTPEVTLGRIPENAQVLRRGLACEPCWTRARFVPCQHRIDCLAGIEVSRVRTALAAALA
jgi:ADP-heptose:LPS heptosyltransferase